MYFNFSLSVAIFGLILYSQVQSLPANEKPPQDLPSPPSNVTSDGKFRVFFKRTSIGYLINVGLRILVF